MRELNMAVLLTLAVSANNHALSTSVGNKLAEVAMDRDTLAHDDGKRSLRVKDRMAETLDEDRMESPPVLRDLISRVGLKSFDHWIQHWNLDALMIEDRRQIVEGQVTDVSEDMLKKLAVGSVLFELFTSRTPYVEPDLSHATYDALSALLTSKQTLLNMLGVNYAVALRHALWLRLNLPADVENEDVIAMAIGGAHFKIFKDREGFHR